MLKVQSWLVANPKVIQSLSACKSHLINLLDSTNFCEMQLILHQILESHDLKGLSQFWAYPPNNY